MVSGAGFLTAPEHNRTACMTLVEFQLALDAWLIAPYRWVAPASAGFLFGTLVLVIQSFVLGKLCLAILEKVQSRIRHQIETEVTDRQSLSLQAISVRDKTAYLAQNDLAQKAYGRSMGLSLGRICASFWPAVMALAWMMSRFSDAPLPLPLTRSGEPLTVSYALVFILLYIAVWVVIRTIKKRMPR